MLEHGFQIQITEAKKCCFFLVHSELIFLPPLPTLLLFKVKLLQIRVLKQKQEAVVLTYENNVSVLLGLRATRPFSG